MRKQQLVEGKGMLGNDYFFTHSASGRQLASERFQISQYAGACPVSLKKYHAATKIQTAKLQIDHRTLRQSFFDLIVTDRLLRVYQDAVLIPYAVEVEEAETDPRWVLCKRPCIVDDFGHQLMSPRDLLNRWIVPLDRRVEYLPLRYGVKT